jgi:hypothetical protein
VIEIWSKLSLATNRVHFNKTSKLKNKTFVGKELFFSTKVGKNITLQNEDNVDCVFVH